MCEITSFTAIVTTSVPLTTEQPTTTEGMLVTEWSEWSVCNASCEQSLGKQQRNRECTYKSSTDTPPKEKCSTFKLLETRTCTLQEQIKCTSPQPKNSVTTTVAEKTTNYEAPEPRNFAIAKPQTATKASYQLTTTAYATSGSVVEAGLTKQQYQILVIALGTAASLFIIIILIYLICGRRNNKKRRRRKLGEISVVALESHMGFMEGMEKYGFKKSMMPNDTVLTSLHDPIIPGHQNSNQISVHENQNSHHIYEDVQLLASEIHHQPRFSNVSLMRRSVSQRETRHDGYNDEIMRRRSCFADAHYMTPHKKAPQKPPRRSMPQLDIPHNDVDSEMTGASCKPRSPALDFIQNIHPPSTTPPITPQPRSNLAATVNKTDSAPPSKSAPASPRNYEMGTLYTTQIPFINCMPSSLLVPYSNIPVMTTMQRHSGDLIYMPSLMPIHQAKIMTDVNTGNLPQSTPLHGTNIRTSEKNIYLTKPRPHSIGVLPAVSVIDTDLYQSLRHVAMTPEICLTDEALRQSDHETKACQRSFKNLHGTQNDEISTAQKDLEKKPSNDLTTEIPEDVEGYVIAMKKE